MLSKSFFSVAAGAVLMASSSVASAEVFDLQVTEDTFLASDSAGENFGSAALLQLEGWVGLGARRPIFKFDLSLIPDGYEIVSASLILSQDGQAEWATFPVELWRLPNDSWSEGTATWDSYNQDGALEVSTLQAPQDPGQRVFDIRLADWDYAADLLDNTVTFQARWGAELSQQYKRLRYSSKEGSAIPTLSIEVIPAPSTLAALGIGGMALLRRRR